MSESLKILLIEDDEDDYLITRTMLSSINAFDVELIWKSDPDSALDAIRHDEFDIYLLDQNLGPITGIEIAARILAMGKVAAVILLTGQDDEELAIEALQTGISDYLVKSEINASNLRRVIQYALASKQTQRELLDAIDAASEANTAKSQFLAKISHELRTPLNSVIGYADLLLTEVAGPLANDKQAEYIEHVKSSGHHLLELINDVLDLSKIEAHKEDLHMRSTAITGAIDVAVERIQNLADQKRITIHRDMPTDAPSLVCDERRIVQVFINLLSNAIKFTPDGGDIYFTCSSGDGNMVLQIRDTGIGIAKDALKKIMQPFEQAGDVLTTPEQGTGLGLPICRSLLELHGATITIRSELGEGTLVEIVFPKESMNKDDLSVERLEV